jgi:hypothetical protein
VAAVALRENVEAQLEPLRTLCQSCALPVLVATVFTVVEGRRVAQVVTADPYEWEPRTRCYVCANNAARAGERCPSCNGSGYAGGARFLTRSTTTNGGEVPVCKRCDGLGAIGAPKRSDCTRCAGAGFVGSPRPNETMLAVDIAWSDDGHIRLLEPSTSRRKGEALYDLHACPAEDALLR